MKKEVTNLVNLLGGSTHYSGKQRIMYITDPEKRVDPFFIQTCVESKFKTLPFTVKTNI